MTYGESKKQILALIEEYAPNMNANDFTEDGDIALRLPYLFDLAYQELSQNKKIISSKIYPEKEKKEDRYTSYTLPSDLYQIKSVFMMDKNNKKGNVDYYTLGKNKIYINDNTEGQTVLEYYKFPQNINEETNDDFYLELDQDAQSVLVYKVASDILKTDPSSDYSSFATEYQRVLQMLDNRRNVPSVTLKEYEADEIECEFDI